MPAYSLGIDIGGTFTDIVAYDHASGRSLTHKELTTPDDPAKGVISGIVRLFDREGLAYRDVSRVVHATTLFANALIERKGAATGLITTEGFRDVLEIGRERKYELYDIFIEMPKPLVRRGLRMEVAERMAPDGTPEIPLDETGLVRQAQALVDAGVVSVAVMFLHAYANPAHERAAQAILRERFPDLFVSISSEIAPEIREFERASTTVANAYIKPIADRYLDNLGREIAALGIGAPLFMMLSNGGLTHVREAKRTPIQLLESGPAAGALAGAFFGDRSAAKSVLAFDMGGTTAKLSVVDDGEPLIGYSFEAAREKRFIEGSGLPINISTIELIEIGAGGGSIAHLDSLGLLKVGPQSAGSQPGPACYGRGGSEPTVTDANLLLGYLNPDFFAGGTIAISAEAASGAMQKIGAATDMSPVGVAWGIHNVVNESMASAARVHIAERGKDPRRYALLTTGGGGPLHGCEVARKLGIKRIVCPPGAGVASALGLLVAPARVDRVSTIAAPLATMDWPAFEAAYATLEADALSVIRDTGIDPETAEVTRLADLRYIGQGFELVTALPPGPYGPGALAGIMAAFEAAYRAVFSRTPPGSVEVVNIRVSARAPAGGADLQVRAPDGATPADALKTSRPVYFGLAGDFVATPVYDRRLLGAGSDIAGPAVIEEPESTLIVPPDGRLVVENSGNLVVTLG